VAQEDVPDDVEVYQAPSRDIPVSIPAELVAVIPTPADLRAAYENLAAELRGANGKAEIDRVRTLKRAAFDAWWNATRYERHPNKKR
jgi:hypothetical protein